MSDANTRQQAEDHYYAALDLMADGKLEEAVTAYRESIAVDPQYRGRGVAQALLDATVARFRAVTLRLMVSTTNAPALRFYRQYGFVRTRLVKRYYGAGRDGWRMRLRVSGPKQ